MTTAAAFHLFAEHPADVLLLEVGLGGRFDATNVVAQPLASVVTPVSMDHVEFLGDTVEKIAREKAGIFKRDRPGLPRPAGRRSARRAAARGPPRRRPAARWPTATSPCARSTAAFSSRTRTGCVDLPLPRLAGRHQHANAALALATLRVRHAPASRPPRSSAASPPQIGRGACSDSPRGHSGRTRCRPAPSCGSTAATTRMVVACSARPWPTSRTRRPGRWW